MNEKNTPETSPKAIKKQQTIRLFVGLIIVACVFLLLLVLLSNHQKVKRDEPKKEEVSFASPIEHTNDIGSLIEREQNRMNKLEEEVNSLGKAKSEQAQDTLGGDSKYQELEHEVDDLKNMLTQKNNGNIPQSGSVDIGKGMQTLNSAAEPDITEDKLELSQKDESFSISNRNPDNYVPSGTFVKAVTLGGADAAAGAASQANPSPMIFRILDNGTLPNHSHGNLKGCTVIGAVAGDISSERGLVRLERLSCTRPSNEILDVAVEGTVFGPEGKNGIRGKPLWREGALLMRAAVAGSLSGFSQALSQNYVTNSTSPLGNTQTINDAFKYGAAQGVSGAMDKLAEYNIQRAEQYHPVIQLSAGTLVDVVFLKGFYLDGKTHSDDERVVFHNTYSDIHPGNAGFENNTVTNDTAYSSSSENNKGLVLTKEQVERIKAHEAALAESSKEK